MAVFEQLPNNLLPGIFLERLNRFVARVKVDNREELAHVPSSGRMRELLVPGAAVFLAPARQSQRKTRYSLLLACFGDTLVSVDSLLPNRLIGAALEKGMLEGLEQYLRKG